MVFFAGADWLVGKWIARTIHLRTADETKSRVETLITDHFSVYWKKKKFFFLVSLCIQLSFGESGRCLPLLRWIMKGGGGAYTFNLSHAYSPRSPPPRKKLVTPDVYPIALKIWDLIFQTGIHLFPLLRYCESILKWKIFLILCLTGCITLRVGFASWQELPHGSYLQACAL